MNKKEQRRAMILTSVIEGRLAAPEAVELMGLSQRQERRLRHALLRDGPAALVHGNPDMSLPTPWTQGRLHRLPGPSVHRQPPH